MHLVVLKSVVLLGGSSAVLQLNWAEALTAPLYLVVLMWLVLLLEHCWVPIWPLVSFVLCTCAVGVA
jgi:hypothetical protein